MHFAAPLSVTVEVRALDVGTRIDRVWRLTRAIGEGGVRLFRDLPFEPGRPVSVELKLPDDDQPLATTGVVAALPPDDEAAEGEAARPRAIAFTALDEDGRRRLARYIDERILAP